MGVEGRIRPRKVEDDHLAVPLVTGRVADRFDDTGRDGAQPKRAQHADVEARVAAATAPLAEAGGDGAAGGPDHLETRGAVQACRGRRSDDERGEQDDERAPQRERPCHGQGAK